MMTDIENVEKQESIINNNILYDILVNVIIHNTQIFVFTVYSCIEYSNRYVQYFSKFGNIQ